MPTGTKRVIPHTGRQGYLSKRLVGARYAPPAPTFLSKILPPRFMSKLMKFPKSTWLCRLNYVD